MLGCSAFLTIHGKHLSTSTTFPWTLFYGGHSSVRQLHNEFDPTIESCKSRSVILPVRGILLEDSLYKDLTQKLVALQATRLFEICSKREEGHSGEEQHDNKLQATRQQQASFLTAMLIPACLFFIAICIALCKQKECAGFLAPAERHMNVDESAHSMGSVGASRESRNAQAAHSNEPAAPPPKVCMSLCSLCLLQMHLYAVMTFIILALDIPYKAES